MAVLVDYACPRCGGRSEHWVSAPVPASQVCPACRGEARRQFASVGFARSSGGSPDAAGVPRRSTPLCVTNPDVPGLCHMSESAGRAWVARARGDNRSLDRELARQEAAAKVRPPTMADVVSHSHQPGHSHSHSSGE